MGQRRMGIRTVELILDHIQIEFLCTPFQRTLALWMDTLRSLGRCDAIASALSSGTLIFVLVPTSIYSVDTI